MRRGRKAPAVRPELAGREELGRLLAAVTSACQSRDVAMIRAALAPLGWLRWSTLPSDGCRSAHAVAIGALLRRRGVLQPSSGAMVATAHALLTVVDRAMADLRTGIEHGNRGLLLEGLAGLEFDPVRAACFLENRDCVSDQAWRDAVSVGACSVRLTVSDSQVVRAAVEAMAELPGGAPAAARPAVLANAAKSLVPAWMRRLLPAGIKQ